MSDAIKFVSIDEEGNTLLHYGTPRHSGRYPWGSGDNPYQHEDSFLRRYRELHASGMSDTEIVKELGLSSVTELRAKRSIDSAGERQYYISQCRKLKAKDYTNQHIAEMLGLAGESTVRGYLAEDAKAKATRNLTLANDLEKIIKEKGCIDVGAGVEKELNVSREALDTALKILEERGYVVDSLYVNQLTNPGQKTTVKYIAVEGTEKPELYQDLSKVQSINAYSPDGSGSLQVAERPTSVDSNRIMVRYAEEGGLEKDGTIEIRRGVDDISLGKASYAQVRIAVDGTHYMKGMAIYSDGSDMPDGVDFIFNTNKKEGTPMMSDDPDAKQVLKTLKSDPDNPFGANITAAGQRHYIDANGEDKLSPVNILKEEGDWAEYSKTLSSQFLSKQSESLIKKQLNLSAAETKEEYDSIMSLSNQAVKKKLLETFAEQCDSAAEDLKAAALPRQATKVILPLTTLKDDEIYAPTYNDGEKVCLVRYPHAGTFEIPVLTVNNKNKEGSSVIGNKAIDAVGIGSKAASQLSGADFDGDTAMVIPINSSVKINTSAPLKGLEGFDSKQYQFTSTSKDSSGKTHYYVYDHEFTPMDSQTKALEMGKVSNLITDMTLRGATTEDLTRAVRHSMVVIDAEKHKLDYKQSEIDNGIEALKQKYQKKADGKYGGASTLVSLAGSTVRVNERKLASYKPDAETGKWVYKETGRTYTDKSGKEVKAQSEVSRMSLTDDAHTLSSGHPKEELYADYANTMKALANTSRKEALSIKSTPVSKTASEIYKDEVESLNNKLKQAQLNAPKERQAQLIANQVANAKIKADPTLDNEHKKRIATQELTKARASVGANKKSVMVDITDKEWEAIQANAISTSKLNDILNNTDLDKVRKLATPKQDTSAISNATKARLKAMLNSGYTIAEVANQLGVSTSTVSKYSKE